MAKTLTAANIIIMLSIPLIFPIPQRIQGFAADDVFDTDAIDAAEVSMGVDGNLSGGFINVPTKQGFTLQANSPSCAFFDNWYFAQKTATDTYVASGVEVLPSLGVKYAMVQGFLTSYTPIPAGKKTLQPRKFGITWESAMPAVA